MANFNKIVIFTALSVIVAFVFSCSTPKVAPQITDKMSTEKIVSIALDYGGVALNVAKDKIIWDKYRL